MAAQIKRHLVIRPAANFDYFPSVSCKLRTSEGVGFYNDEVGCPYAQVFTTNLPFGPLDGDA